METYINIHTGKQVKVCGSILVSNPPVRVFIMDDKSRWNQNDFLRHHRRLDSEVIGDNVAPIAQSPTEA